jgi:aryl-alcohol dehydrogenase-like predicted oxidoreductase
MFISPLILGSWQFGETSWGFTEEKELIALTQEALDQGINMIDTAWVYGKGKSEEIIGKAIKGRRDKVFIATKCLPQIDRLHTQLEESLRRLQVSYIDLYQIHWLSSDAQVKPILEQINKFREEGKIRHIGVSNFSKKNHEEALKYAPIISSQPPYSMLKRGIEQDIIPFCLKHKIGILAYSPLQKGLLTGKYLGNETFPKGDVRSWDEYFTKERFKKNVALVDQLKPIAHRYGKTLAQLALNWTFTRPGITAAIMGVKSRHQLRDNLGALGWAIEPQDLLQIDTLLSA